jgi:hypothetical protein
MLDVQLLPSDTRETSSGRLGRDCVFFWDTIVDNVGRTRINHPFGNGNHTTYKIGGIGDGLILF